MQTRISDDQESGQAPPLIPEEELTAADVVRMFDIGVKIERLSRDKLQKAGRSAEKLP
jgi:hypothetical protein